MNAQAQHIMEEAQKAEALPRVDRRINPQRYIRVEDARSSMNANNRAEAVSAILEIAHASGFSQSVLMQAVGEAVPDLRDIMADLRHVKFFHPEDEENPTLIDCAIDGLVRMRNEMEGEA